MWRDCRGRGKGRIAELVAVGAIDAGMGEQALADRLAGRADVTDTAHGVALLPPSVPASMPVTAGE